MYFAFNCTLVPFLLHHLPNIRILLGVLTPLTLPPHSVVDRCPHSTYPADPFSCWSLSSPHLPCRPIQSLLGVLTPLTLHPIQLLLGFLTPLTLQPHSAVARFPHPTYPTSHSTVTRFPHPTYRDVTKQSDTFMSGQVLLFRSPLSIKHNPITFKIAALFSVSFLFYGTLPLYLSSCLSVYTPSCTLQFQFR